MSREAFDEGYDLAEAKYQARVAELEETLEHVRSALVELNNGFADDPNWPLVERTLAIVQSTLKGQDLD